MKIVIFNAYGDSGFPDCIGYQIKNKTFPQDRYGKVIDILESYPSIDDKKLLENLYNRLKEGQVLRSGDYFWFGRDEEHFISHIQCKIVEVDTNRKWTISEYDGAEYIEYLDFKCVDENINFWEKCMK